MVLDFGGGEVKERPILFNTEMVRAILDGRKTSTRRVVKGNPNSLHYDPIVIGGKSGYRDEHGKLYNCPFGEVGDRLWVRETGWFKKHDKPPYNTISAYKTNWENTEETPWGNMEPKHWIPSIHMPRWASRITLDITGIRIEQIKDITDDDALREGITFRDDEEVWKGRPIIKFQSLWDSIYANDGICFCDNPYVWVVDFEVMK